MRTRSITVLLLMIAVAAALSGCGSGDDGGSSLSKTAYLKKANALCAKRYKERLLRVQKASEELERVPGDITTVDKAKLLKRMKGPFLASARTMIDELSELGPPKKDGDEAEEVVDFLEETLVRLEDAPSKDLATGFHDANAAVEAYGLRKCHI